VKASAIHKRLILGQAVIDIAHGGLLPI